MMMDLFKRKDGVNKLSDVVVPKKFFARIKVGVEALDFAFGGENPGIVPGTSYMLTGSPGAGKSTLCLQLADWLVKSGHRVLYNIGEENVFMTKMRADRIGVAGNFNIGQIEDVDKLVKQASTDKVDVLIQDSLQSMRQGDLRGHNLLRLVTKKLVRLSKDHDTVVFLVGHITKGGGFAGPEEIKHDVDAHAELTLDKNTGCRTFSLSKNRFGPACIPYELNLTDRGISFGQPEQVQAAATTRQTDDGVRYHYPGETMAERRSWLLDFIKEKLLAGEKISGYCYQRFRPFKIEGFEFECSGGFWRALCRQACDDLSKKGYSIGAVTIDRRLHNFVNN